MKRGTALLIVLVAAALTVFAEVNDIKHFPECRYCGMDREKFGPSRMLIEYDDGTSVATCSLHCASVELALSIDKTPKAILAADMTTQKLIDADKAVWVIGGNKPGVMTKRPKWAFERKEDAERFIKQNGGKLSFFEEAIKFAYEDMYQDTKMIREKRAMMMPGMNHRPREMDHAH